MIIIAFDPSIREFGISVIDSETDEILHAECVKTKSKHDELNLSKSKDRTRRVSVIVNRILQCVENYDLDLIVSELPGGSQSASAAECLGIVKGLVQTFSDCYEIPLVWISEIKSKKTMLGKRSADKIEMVNEVNSRIDSVPVSGEAKDGAPWTGIKYRDQAIADSIGVYFASKKHSDQVT
jgi:Holliday junction resolvasome RuvABC endonuclease subunit